MKNYDLIVLGGGRASNLAAAAGKAGWKVALIERDRLGGTCPNRGCVPSKLLIGFGEAARKVKEAGRHFVDAEYRGIDLKKVFDSMHEFIEGVDGRYEGRLPESVDLYRGQGRFVADKDIEVNGEVLRGERVVIATGSRPRPIPFELEGVWTSDDLFPLRDAVPQTMTVIGGGVIGCEIGSFLSAVGVKTDVFVRGNKLLAKEDHQIQEVFAEEFSKHCGVRFGLELKELVKDEAGFRCVFEDRRGSTVEHRSERVLFATGRIPNADEIGLENTSIERDRRGFIVSDDHLETSVPGVYAAGDVAGRYILQHTASYDVHYLRRRLLKGDESALDYGPVPHAVFADPEVAGVGKTEDELKAEDAAYVAVWADWLASARAMAMRIKYPRIKLLVDPQDWRILGCHLVGPEAATLLHQVLPVMRLKNDVRELAELMHVHPALNELFLAAAVKAVGAVRKWRAEAAEPVG